MDKIIALAQIVKANLDEVRRLQALENQFIDGEESGVLKDVLDAELHLVEARETALQKCAELVEAVLE